MFFLGERANHTEGMLSREPLSRCLRRLAFIFFFFFCDKSGCNEGIQARPCPSCLALRLVYTAFPSNRCLRLVVSVVFPLCDIDHDHRKDFFLSFFFFFVTSMCAGTRARDLVLLRKWVSATRRERERREIVPACTDRSSQALPSRKQALAGGTDSAALVAFPPHIQRRTRFWSSSGSRFGWPYVLTAIGSTFCLLRAIAPRDRPVVRWW